MLGKSSDQFLIATPGRLRVGKMEAPEIDDPPDLPDD
jgi:hypothetical protein